MVRAVKTAPYSASHLMMAGVRSRASASHFLWTVDYREATDPAGADSPLAKTFPFKYRLHERDCPGEVAFASLTWSLNDESLRWLVPPEALRTWSSNLLRTITVTNSHLRDHTRHSPGSTRYEEVRWVLGEYLQKNATVGIVHPECFERLHIEEEFLIDAKVPFKRFWFFGATGAFIRRWRAGCQNVAFEHEWCAQGETDL